MSPTVSFVSWLGPCRRSTVFASLDVRAAEMIRVFSNIGLAGLFRDTMFVCIGINFTWVATIA